MTWFKVDDGFAFHPKALSLTPAAGWLWVRAGAWSAAQLTNGRIPAGMVVAFGATVREAEDLVAAGLWKPDGSDWLFHDWLDYQPSREQVEAERAAAKDRQRKAREAAKAARDRASGHGVTSGEVLPESPGSNAGSNGPPDPTRPEGSKEPSGRAERLPDDFAPTAELRQWASENTPDVNVDDQTTRFIDYWRGIGGQRGRKVDWPGTWRNWLRKAQDDCAPARPRGPTEPDLGRLGFS